LNEIHSLEETVEIKQKILLEPKKGFTGNFNYWFGLYLAYKAKTLALKNIRQDFSYWEAKITKSGIEKKREVVNNIAKLGDKTLKNYFNAIYPFYQLLIQMKAKSLLQITNKVIAYWLTEHTDIWASSTKLNRLDILLDFFSFIKKNSYIKENLDYLNLDRKELIKYIEKESKVVESLSIDDFTKFIGYASNLKYNKNKKTSFEEARDRLILLMFCYGGFRTSELLSIKIDNIEYRSEDDWSFYYIKVIGKGNKERIILIDALDIEQQYEEYMQYRTKLNLNNEFLFVTKNNTQMQPMAIYRIVSRALEKQNIKSSKKGAHILRHSYATYLLHSGVPINIVKQLLGHESILTTQKYLHVKPEDIKHWIKT